MHTQNEQKSVPQADIPHNDHTQDSQPGNPSNVQRQTTCNQAPSKNNIVNGSYPETPLISRPEEQKCSLLTKNKDSLANLNQGVAAFPQAQAENVDLSAPEVISMCHGRYANTDVQISKSHYRTIYRGYDNDSGCEIAWCVYQLKNLNQEEIASLSHILANVKNVIHHYILKCYHYEIVLQRPNVKNRPEAPKSNPPDEPPLKNNSVQENLPKLILITELITAGSIREYLKKIRNPRLIVIKQWCYKILQGLVFLHTNETELVHGKLTCESIYINSNNGDIKIGDLGIRQIPLFNSKKTEIYINILKTEKKTPKYDVYCFGLCLLEMISSDIQVPHAFKYLCKLINQGKKNEILNMIQDEQLKDILDLTLRDSVEDRQNVSELQNHSFFQKSALDHKAIQMNPELSNLVRQAYDIGHAQNSHLSSPSTNLSGPSQGNRSHNLTLLSQKELVLNKSYQSTVSSQLPKSQTFKIQPNMMENETEKQSSIFLQQIDEDSSVHTTSQISKNTLAKPPHSSKPQSQIKKKKPKETMKFVIKLRHGAQKYVIDFIYNFKEDNPNKIATEMRNSLNLPDHKIDLIQKEIETKVEQHLKKGAAKQEPKKTERVKFADQHISHHRLSVPVAVQPPISNVEEPVIGATAKGTDEQELIKQRRKVMREKSNNISSITKSRNAKGSSMEPIEEEDRLGNIDNSNSNKEKSNKSLQEVSKGMLQPKIPIQANKTVNYEIYNGNEKDKVNCPQNTKLVNKKEFVYSVQYPHHATLNISQNGSKNSLKNKIRRKKSKDAKNLVLEEDHYYNSVCALRDLDIQNDRNELIDIIDQIHEHDRSVIPGPNFLHQEYPDYKAYLEEYHLRQEKELINRQNNFNESLLQLEFDYNLDFENFSANQGDTKPPFESDISLIVPVEKFEMLQIQHFFNQAEHHPNATAQHLQHSRLYDHILEQLQGSKNANLSKNNIQTSLTQLSFNAHLSSLNQGKIHVQTSCVTAGVLSQTVGTSSQQLGQKIEQIKKLMQESNSTKSEIQGSKSETSHELNKQQHK